MASMNVLDVAIARKVHRSERGDVVAIEDLAFELPRGQFTCVVGPSGCGKTTMLSIIAGLDRGYEGKVERHEGQLGVVFQTPRLMPWLTVRENVRLALAPPPRAPGRAETMLADVGLEALLDAFPGQLSGGQQRRAALARALVNDPDLLLLDEPFLSLDAPSAQHLRDFLLGIWQRRRPTVLFITHDLREALSIGERVLFLTAGPARVALDLPLDSLPRPRHPDSPMVEAARRRLMENHPDLLRGLSGGSGMESAA
jgi:NitT/TauT family transport system ATP-binding protein